MQDVGLVKGGPTYEAADKECNWDAMEDKSLVSKAKDYKYIGGYYGACSETKMMESLQKGPIVVALNAPPDLFYYGDGIYQAELQKDKDQYDLNGPSRPVNTRALNTHTHTHTRARGWTNRAELYAVRQR